MPCVSSLIKTLASRRSWKWWIVHLKANRTEIVEFLFELRNVHVTKGNEVSIDWLFSSSQHYDCDRRSLLNHKVVCHLRVVLHDMLQLQQQREGITMINIHSLDGIAGPRRRAWRWARGLLSGFTYRRTRRWFVPSIQWWWFPWCSSFRWWTQNHTRPRGWQSHRSRGHSWSPIGWCSRWPSCSRGRWFVVWCWWHGYCWIGWP